MSVLTSNSQCSPGVLWGWGECTPMWPYVNTYMYCSTESNGGVDLISVLTSNSQCSPGVL